MTIHVAVYRASCTLPTSTAHSSQFKNEIIVLLQTSTMCEVVKFVKQKAGSLMYHIHSARKCNKIAQVFTLKWWHLVFFYTFNV